MSANKLFDKFYQNILLTQKQKDDARVKYTGVCKKLHDNYYQNIKYDGKTKLLIGSYGKKTNIRPPRDVDVLFIMPDELYARYDGYKGNGQSQLLQDIRAVLSQKYTATDRIKGWGKVILVQFADGTHDIELLPAWQLLDGTFIIPNSERGGSWEHWDPRSEINNIQRSNNETDGITIRIIRMLKRWAQNCTVGLKSYKIENYVVDCYRLNGTQTDEYCYLLKNIFNYLSGVVYGPDQSHIKTAYNRACKAAEHCENGNLRKASEEWQKIFGNDFPLYQEDSVKTIKFIDRYPTHTEEYISNYGIVEDLRYKLTINAKVRKKKGFREQLLSAIGFLNKQRTLDFHIAHTNAPDGYEVWWKVKNQGEEAKNDDDLRGEITRNSGARKTETTKYTGCHYVECYLVKGNVCIAKHRVFVNIK